VAARCPVCWVVRRPFARPGCLVRPAPRTRSAGGGSAVVNRSASAPSGLGTGSMTSRPAGPPGHGRAGAQAAPGLHGRPRLSATPARVPQDPRTGRTPLPTTPWPPRRPAPPSGSRSPAAAMAAGCGHGRAVVAAHLGWAKARTPPAAPGGRAPGRCGGCRLGPLVGDQWPRRRLREFFLELFLEPAAAGRAGGWRARRGVGRSAGSWLPGNRLGAGCAGLVRSPGGAARLGGARRSRRGCRVLSRGRRWPRIRAGVGVGDVGCAGTDGMSLDHVGGCRVVLGVRLPASDVVEVGAGLCG
jgi:hypothetical protein